MKRPRIARSFDAAKSSERRFRALALAALEKQQFERSRLARKLHDDVAQILSGAGLQLDILRMDLEQKVPEIGARTTEVQNLLERAAHQIRDLSRELSPAIVEHAGLQAALEMLLGRVRKDFGGTLRLTYDSSVDAPAAAAVAMERIAREAVVNAVQHARCHQIDVTLKSTAEGPVLEIRDDGRGFDYARAPCGLGLPMMEYCASKAGLHLQINGQDKNGTTVTAGGARKGRHAIQCSSCG
jgi:two-component system NarL family sensor kinase